MDEVEYDCRKTCDKREPKMPTRPQTIASCMSDETFKKYILGTETEEISTDKSIKTSKSKPDSVQKKEEEELLIEEEMEEEEEEEESEEEEEDEFYCTHSNPPAVFDQGELGKSGWEKIVKLKDPWNPSRFPFVKVLERLKIPDDPDGYLTHLKVASQLSCLTKVPNEHVYTAVRLDLPQKGIKCIDVLSDYPYLQYIDLSDNQIQDLSPLNNVKYLMVLDASSNQIQDISNFTPPWFLTYINLSNNGITEMPDFSEFWSLRSINLSKNQIEHISPLIELKYLIHLNLSNNKLKAVENLNHTTLVELNLSHNAIEEWTSVNNVGCESLVNLEGLNVSFNCFTTLTWFKGLVGLKHLDVSYNCISDVFDLDCITYLSSLVDLSIEGNCIANLPDIRKILIHLSPQLEVLNSVEVKTVERVLAKELYEKDEVILSKEKLAEWLLKAYASTRVYEDIYNPHEAYHPALLILAGVPGSPANYRLANLVATKYPEYVRFAMFHTTRSNIRVLLNNQKTAPFHYISDSEFIRMFMNGEFICTDSFLNKKFGLSYEELLFDGRVCITAMSFSAALTFKSKLMFPSLMVGIPGNDVLLEDRIIQYCYENDLMDQILKKNAKEGGAFNKDQTVSSGMTMDSLNHVVKAEKTLPGLYSRENRISGKRMTTQESGRLDKEGASKIESSTRAALSSPNAWNDLIEKSKTIPGQSPFKPGSQSSSEDETPKCCEFLGVRVVEVPKLSYSREDFFSEDSNDHICDCDESVNSQEEEEKDESQEGSVKSEEESRTFLKAIEKVLRQIIEGCKNRHYEVPGTFLKLVYTENEEEAIEEISQTACHIYNNIKYVKPPYNPQEDPYFTSIIDERVETLMEELKTSNFANRDLMRRVRAIIKNPTTN